MDTMGFDCYILENGSLYSLCFINFARNAVWLTWVETYYTWSSCPYYQIPTTSQGYPLCYIHEQRFLGGAKYKQRIISDLWQEALPIQGECQDWFDNGPFYKPLCKHPVIINASDSIDKCINYHDETMFALNHALKRLHGWQISVSLYWQATLLSSSSTLELYGVFPPPSKVTIDLVTLLSYHVPMLRSLLILLPTYCKFYLYLPAAGP